MKKQIMSIKFDSVTMSEAVSIAEGCIASSEKCMVVTPNAEIGYAAEKDEKFAELINSAKLVLPDGVGVVLASRIIGDPVKEKVAGVEFAENLIKSTAHPVFFFGGKPGVAETARDKMKAKYPSCNIVGVRDGYFKEKDIPEIINQINESGAKIVFVCLGAPKQELFIQAHMHEMNAYVFAGLGGSLDIFAGTAKRAPEFFVKFGLEWLYRLIKQPSRIKRMSVLPLYVIESIKYRLGGKK